MKHLLRYFTLCLPAFGLLVACGDDSPPAETRMGDAGEQNGGTPTVTGPIADGMETPFTTSVVDLGSRGYSEKEFFFEGDATAYEVQGEKTMDGEWDLSETSQAAFKTRLLVRRPVDADDFNGTVVVEWLNVSSGVDADPGFLFNVEEILREGYAWVGVSAQATGIEGGGFSLVENAVPLKEYDPERYGSLSHPGDAYSFDIYTQAAEVIRGAGEVDVLEGLQPERLMAYGESQSAMRLVSYVNGVHPLVEVYDGFFIHSRGAGGVPFGNDAGLGMGSGEVARIRNDIGAPVFQFQTETDVLGEMFGFIDARQPDGERLRTWEVAGTAHVDQYLLNLGEDAENMSGIMCENANDGPQHFVIRAALHHLDRWMRDGTEPPQGEELMADENGMPVTDEHGNTLGGVRTPDVDVPIATLSGQPAEGENSNFLCFLFGHTDPFSSEKLMELYPTHEDYVTKVEEAASEAQQAGFLLEPEAQAMVAEAESAPVPD